MVLTKIVMGYFDPPPPPQIKYAENMMGEEEEIVTSIISIRLFTASFVYKF